MQDSLKKHFEDQVISNRGKNLFFENLDQSMQFIQHTAAMIRQLHAVDEDTESVLIDYATERVLAEFYRANQYYYFDTTAHKALRKLYEQLFLELKKAETEQLSAIASQHYQRLKTWLKTSNAFAEKINPGHREMARDVPCSEYSAAMQLQVLGLQLSTLKAPILDIGCGQSGKLVGYLRQNGIEAYGIDRLAAAVPFCQNADWLQFHYGVAYWGTIISNLGFSNHFKHHHLRSDGNYLIYAQQYMTILRALTPGGQFCYAPALPFVEELLDRQNFDIQRIKTATEDLESAIITRKNTF